MSLLSGLVEKLAPIVGAPIENYVWEAVPEEWKSELCYVLAGLQSELYALLKAKGTLVEEVWSELLKDAKGHLETALGEGMFEKIDQYVKVGK